MPVITGSPLSYVASVAAIEVGCALLAHGAAVTARWPDTMRRAVADRSAMARGRLCRRWSPAVASTARFARRLQQLA